MAAPPTGTRDEMIARFWGDVHTRLLKQYGRKPAQADQGIGGYRRQTEELGLGETVYNQGVEQTAEVVNGVIEHGLPPLPPR